MAKYKKVILEFSRTDIEILQRITQDGQNAADNALM
jgi:hypothetical protein